MKPFTFSCRTCLNFKINTHSCWFRGACRLLPDFYKLSTRKCFLYLSYDVWLLNQVPPCFYFDWSVVIFFIFMRLFLFFSFLFHSWHMYVSIISEAFYVGSASYTDHTKPLSNAWNHNKAHKDRIQYNHPSQPSRASFAVFCLHFLKPHFGNATTGVCCLAFALQSVVGVHSLSNVTAGEKDLIRLHGSHS